MLAEEVDSKSVWFCLMQCTCTKVNPYMGCTECRVNTSELGMMQGRRPKCISSVGVRLIISHLSAWGIILQVLQIKLKTHPSRNANEILQQMFTFRQKQNFQSSTLRCGSKYSLFWILIASFIFNPPPRLWSIIWRIQLFKGWVAFDQRLCRALDFTDRGRSISIARQKINHSQEQEQTRKS